MKMLSFLSIVVTIGISDPTFAGDDDDDIRVKVALAISRARSDEIPLAVMSGPDADFSTDIPTSTRKAAQEKRVLVIWVGIRCKDYRAMRECLARIEPAPIQCHADSYLGRSDARIIIYHPGLSEASSWLPSALGDYPDQCEHRQQSALLKYARTRPQRAQSPPMATAPSVPIS